MYLSHIGFIEEEKKKLSPDFTRHSTEESSLCNKNGHFYSICVTLGIPFPGAVENQWG